MQQKSLANTNVVAEKNIRALLLTANAKDTKKDAALSKKVCQLQECEQARGVAGNILKSFDMMWLFVENPEIEPINNFAKR